MPESPRVSVMMTVYNAEAYVAEAVESILAQTLDDFELNIINDGSTDSSRGILEQLAARDRRIRLVSRPNQGIAKSRSEVLAMCSGQYLAVMDADDISLPQRLERQVTYLEEHPECAMVGSRVTLIDPAGRPLTVIQIPLEHEEIDSGLMANNGQLIYNPAVMIRKTAMDRIGGYRPEHDWAEDMDVFLRLAEIGRIANLPEPLLQYREHMAKAGRAKVTVQNQALHKAIMEAHRRRGLPPPLKLRDAQDTSLSRSEIYRTWGWWALASGHVAVARKYAVACLPRTPFDPASWKLLYCAIRGR